MRGGRSRPTDNNTAQVSVDRERMDGVTPYLRLDRLHLRAAGNDDAGACHPSWPPDAKKPPPAAKADRG